MSMPRTNVYIKDSDVKVYEKAKKKLGDSVSSIFIDCLRQRLAELDVPPKARQATKIKLTFWNENEQPVISKSFLGRWLVGTASEGVEAREDSSGVSWGRDLQWSVAQTAQGKIVVYCQHRDDYHPPTMKVHDSFEHMKEALMDKQYPMYPENVLAETAAALRIPFDIELDI